MKVLLIGNGGRESAIAAKLSESEIVDKIYIAPGNGGTIKYGENIEIGSCDIEQLIMFVEEKNIDFTVVGPEQPLIEGIVDEFENRGLKIFGPNKKAAMVEGSKDFSKKIMKQKKIPTANYETFTSYKSAEDYIKKSKYPLVIKADGIAAGKGVLIAQNYNEGKEFLKDVMNNNKFGKSGNKIVIEEFLIGEEASILAFTDGKTIIPMVSAQDHKQIFNGDKGPNTGGMGAYSPAPIVTNNLLKKTEEDILIPFLNGLKDEGITYKGVLYVGLMINKDEPKVVEFNARFGDPETQVVLPRLKSDLAEIFLAVIDEKLDKVKMDWDNNHTVCVVAASKGYPDKYEKGKVVTGIEKLENSGLEILHAGTKNINGKIITNGGRVLGVVSKKDNLEAAIDEIYNNIEKLNFDGIYYRTDIGFKAISD